MSTNSHDIRSLLPTPAPIAVLRAATSGSALEMAKALVAGGLQVLEVTLTTPGALKLITELAADPTLVVGAGTVTRPHEVDEVISAGAQFVVSPGLDPEVVEAGLRHSVPMLPGAITPTEVMAARRCGVTSTKLFPAGTVGPAHLSALGQVFPEIGFVPTGGIGPDDVGTWIRAGACAIGIGSVINSTFTSEGHHGLEQLATHLIRSCEQAARKQ